MNVADNFLNKTSPRRTVFITIKNLLVLQKSPDTDPPPGGSRSPKMVFGEENDNPTKLWSQ